MKKIYEVIFAVIFIAVCLLNAFGIAPTEGTTLALVISGFMCLYFKLEAKE